MRGGVPGGLTGIIRADDNVPTCVGVYRLPKKSSMVTSKCPHVRGGVPKHNWCKYDFRAMSPRAWGCTASNQIPDSGYGNVPTCVGVYRA